MAKTYQNTIPNSPITKVEIDDDKGITLYGTPNIPIILNKYIPSILNKYIPGIVSNYTPSILRKSHADLYYLFDFIAKEKNSPAVTPEIDNAIQNFYSSHAQTLQDRASEIYLRMQPVIKQKLQEAKARGKKLLVIMGERHQHRDSQLIQLLALDICLKNGIKDLLLETDDQGLKDFLHQEKWRNFIDFYRQGYLMTNIMPRIHSVNNISLACVDPLHEDLGNGTATMRERDICINQEIAKTQKDAIIIIGAGHIRHITTDPDLSAQYIFLNYQTADMYYQTADMRPPHCLNFEDELSASESEKLEQETKKVTDKIINLDCPDTYFRKYGALPNSTKSHKESFLRKQFMILRDEYVYNAKIQHYLMEMRKDDAIHPQEEIIRLALTDKITSPGDSVASSDIEILDTVINIISQHNAESKILNGLRYIQTLYDKMLVLDYHFSPEYKHMLQSDLEILKTGTALPYPEKLIFIQNFYNSSYCSNKMEEFDQRIITHDLDTWPDC